MTTRTTIHLMRHGEVHNPLGVLYGRIAGYNLSELGHEMAAKVAISRNGYFPQGLHRQPRLPATKLTARARMKVLKKNDSTPCISTMRRMLREVT